MPTRPSGGTRCQLAAPSRATPSTSSVMPSLGSQLVPNNSVRETPAGFLILGSSSEERNEALAAACTGAAGRTGGAKGGGAAGSGGFGGEGVAGLSKGCTGACTPGLTGTGPAAGASCGLTGITGGGSTTGCGGSTGGGETTGL